MPNISVPLKSELPLKNSKLSSTLVHQTYGFLVTAVGLLPVLSTKHINQDHQALFPKMELAMKSNTVQEVLKDS